MVAIPPLPQMDSGFLATKTKNMKKIYDILYSKDSTGKIRTWRMEQLDNKYRTHSGVKGSDNQVVSEWTVCDGKNVGRSNETNGIQQATAEIEAKYVKKLKTDYSKDIGEVDTACKYIEPILAKSYKDYTDSVIFDGKTWGMQNKFNGVCCITSTNGAYSRKGESFKTIVHITNVLSPLFNKYPDLVLHGELFNDDYREKLNELIKLIRKTVNITAEDLTQSEKIVQYFIYDGYCESAGIGESAPYIKRKEWLDKHIVEKIKYCKTVDTVLIKNKDHLDKFFGERIERGDEGVILRKMDMKYEHKRSKNLLKYKPLDSAEGMLISIHEGAGNWSGAAKTATIKWGEKTFDATFKGTYDELVEILKNQNNWTNKSFTFQYNGLTGLQTPNYARIDIHNCNRVD